MRPMEEPEIRASGNKEVIKLLEDVLERAKTHGRIAFVSVVICENLKHVVSTYAGSLDLAFAANWGLDTAKYQLMARAHGRHDEPFEAPSLGQEAARIRFDITKGPACYDFISWLVLAEMNRIREGAPAPLKVGFSMIDTPAERALHKNERERFYKNVIFPSLSFVGAVADPASNEAPVMEKYTIRPVVEFARKGEVIPLLKPNASAVGATERFLYSLEDKRRPVTITLREVVGKWEFRNSNIHEWLKVADYLTSKGERVIFVRDTDHAQERLDGYRICSAASTDVHRRLALYEAAKANLFVSNGPWMLALHGSRPWLMFVETKPMSPFFPETPQFWIQWHGISPGEQFPWSLPTQQIIWQRDNADNIIAAWDRLEPLLQKETEDGERDSHSALTAALSGSGPEAGRASEPHKGNSGSIEATSGN